MPMLCDFKEIELNRLFEKYLPIAAEKADELINEGIYSEDEREGAIHTVLKEIIKQKCG